MAANPELKQKVEEVLQENNVLLFMKGTPEMPRCGFSMRVVGVLEQLGVEYGAVDVLPVLDPLREVTGEISDWRTFPQLYVNGELVGGSDIVEEMFDSGELAQLVGAEQPETVEAPRSQAPADPQQSPRCISIPRARWLDRGGLLGGVVAHLEGGAAAAGRDDVRVVDHEPRALQAVDVVDLGAEDELHADLVDHHGDALALEDVIVLLGLVEGERVLEA